MKCVGRPFGCHWRMNAFKTFSHFQGYRQKICPMDFSMGAREMTNEEMQEMMRKGKGLREIGSYEAISSFGGEKESDV